MLRPTTSKEKAVNPSVFLEYLLQVITTCALYVLLKNLTTLIFDSYGRRSSKRESKTGKKSTCR